MNNDEIILMILDAAKDGVPGKTTMQKLCYFSSIMLKQDMGFFAHYYGPYSKEIAQNLQLLTDFDIINRETSYTHSNREFTKFDLNQDGKNYIKKIKKENPEEYEIIRQIVEQSEKVNLDYNILSYAAKIYYIIDEEDRKLSPEELIELASYHDWQLSDSQIESAKTILAGLDLVSFTV